MSLMMNRGKSKQGMKLPVPAKTKYRDLMNPSYLEHTHTHKVNVGNKSF